MEPLLTGELRGLGAGDVRRARAGVAFRGPLALAYRVCLWTRLASRVLLPLASGRATNADELYATVQGIDWDAHIPAGGTIAVDFTGTNRELHDTRFGAVRVKDAIVDQLRERHGTRPSVDAHNPDVRINAHLAGFQVTISIDLSGDSLHRRGYRMPKVQVAAPLKENLAAAVLLFAEWPRLAAAGAGFVDPLCGSGTLPIEAALIAADIAPGLLRAERAEAGFGFTRWAGHEPATWTELLSEARERREAGLGRSAATPGLLRGSDRDAHALDVARACAARAGVGDIVDFARADLADLRAPAAHGLVAANPPYGERLGERAAAQAVYEALGLRLSAGFNGWRAAVLTGDQDLPAATGLPVKRETTLYNGALPVRLTLFETGAHAGLSRREREHGLPRHGAGTPSASPPAGRTGLVSGGAEQFANRLRKNRRRLAKLVRREGLECYRLYDADLPDYNLVVDVYGDWVHAQEYAAPAEIDPSKAQRRLDEALAVIAAELEMPGERVVLKQRRRQRGAAQYERQRRSGTFFKVAEDGLTYLVNLTDFLDTGLFIDQRLTRRHLRRLAGGRRFLNLFAYTATMTVDALAGGSPASTTVDLSSTYLDWGRRNLAANGFAVAAPAAGPSPAGPHRLVQADCLRWIAEAEGQYDLVWLDPPTFSNSKRMGRATFDVQRDHADLIRLTARRLLAPGGVLLFATNRRGFHLDRDALHGLHVEDLSRATLPPDCARAANRHHVIEIRTP